MSLLAKSCLLKLVCLSLFTLGLASAASGFAQAQTLDEPVTPTRGYYAAGSLGIDSFLNVGTALEMTGTFGFEKLLFGLDVRGELGLIAKDSIALKVGADVLYGFGNGSADTFSVYLGAGPRLVVGRTFDVGVGALVNFDIASDERASLFVEPGLDVYLLGATQLAPSVSVGVRYRF